MRGAVVTEDDAVGEGFRGEELETDGAMARLRVFTTEKWFVQLGMAARGIACCSKCGTPGRIVMRCRRLSVPLAPE